MARYISDQNKVIGIYESGLYGTRAVSGTDSAVVGSTFQIGQVTSHTVDDNRNYTVDRHMGTASRSIDGFDASVNDVTGTLSYRMQDMRIPFYAIGSVAASGANHTYWKVTQIDADVQQNMFTSGMFNPPRSFTIEDSKQAAGTGKNFVRSVQGVIPNTVTINFAQGEIVTCDVDYIGHHIYFTSGATTSGALNSGAPYSFGHVSLSMDGESGLPIKEGTFEINNNLVGPHYLNGSVDIATPYMGNRDYTLSVTMDLDSNTAKKWYEQYLRGGSKFNSTLDFNNDVTAGSHHATFWLSGCYVTSMDNPSEVEGASESTMEVRVTDVYAEEHTMSGNRYEFNPW